ncbi:hypothetical protein L249_3927 [Ophiocordyceps polyrhachis-furcata BCC 54312]|uniref:Uncharacterized protein n=1 Tax=Ophiocordyceps polyrhachis-furcata BCC 54312 TaxID=1330021 RepID=A0A367L539_9HYPO|nr:hypothetical protein L249_3927 [Ophiocordyceps polyrhachis-furcata BCC 54312]
MSNVSYSQFVCVGAGFSGIALGATLKRWYGIDNVRFFERHADLGGTWFINTYPGCACDVPVILYSFSFAPNANWSRTLPSSAELWAYLKRVADEYDLTSKMTFGADVIRCEWRQDSNRWRLQVRDVKSGAVFHHESRFLFCAGGVLVRPKVPDLPGLSSFAGTVLHASQWSNDVQINDKKVVVVGNGCTAAQIIPTIIHRTRHLSQFIRSKQWYLPPIDINDKKVVVVGNGCTAAQIIPTIIHRTRHLSQFIRSKQWYLPPIDVAISDFTRWLFAHVPGILFLARFWAFCNYEDHLRGFYMTEAGARYRSRQKGAAVGYMKRAAPEKYHHLIIPDFEIGCKRRIFDSGYLRSLHAPNISLSDEPIVEVLPDAVRTRDGTLTPADVIILATGFVTNQFLHGVDLVGRGGVTLDKHWSKYGGPEAYNCVALNQFPNMFMILGPNTVTGHTSTIMAIENGVNYALRVIKPVLDDDNGVVEIKPGAEARYSREMQQALRKTVWFSGCHSWYNHEGPDGKTWNAMTYPRTQWDYWYQCLFPAHRDWSYVNATPTRTLLRSGVLVLVGLAVAAVGVWLAVEKRGPLVGRGFSYVRPHSQA